jgi:DNA-binding response OmpR family regulator
MTQSGDGRARRSAALSVVIVDPDWEGARLLAGHLAGAQIVIVGSSAEAGRALQLRMPDLIVTELDLPDDDGVRLVREIHRDMRTHHVLLMVVTRRGSIQDKIAALQAGADDYLVKPVDPRQFVAHVRAVSRFRQVLKRQ